MMVVEGIEPEELRVLMRLVEEEEEGEGSIIVE